MKVAIIGCGGLGTSIARGLMRSHGQEFQLSFCDHDRKKSDALATEITGAAALATVGEAVGTAEVVIIAVKPKDVKEVVNQIGAKLSANALVVSCATGIATDSLESWVGNKVAVARAMPNTAVSVGAGTTGLFLGSACEPQRDTKRLQQIFSALGDVKMVGSENDLHAVTALSGSGPAFVLLMLEAMIDAGVRSGLARTDAEFFAKGALKGASALASKSTMSVYDLRAQITSPGGTTIEGLYTLEQGGFRHAIMDAVEAAEMRSIDLMEAEAFDA